MKTKPALISACFVAEFVNWHMTGGWQQGEHAVVERFRGENTFEAAFSGLLDRVEAAGFRQIDLWQAHLGVDWASDRQIETAVRRLDDRGITVTSYVGGVETTPEAWARIGTIAKALNTTLISGGWGLLENRESILPVIRQHGLRVAIENHPEKTPEELLAKLGSDDDCVGAAVDTGWFATAGYPADKALRRLGPRIFHVHLKDIRQPEPEGNSGFAMKDMGHETCALGDGIVPIQSCLKVLDAVDYSGPLSIEHEPEMYDPSDEIRISRERLEGWIGTQ